MVKSRAYIKLRVHNYYIKNKKHISKRVKQYYKTEHAKTLRKKSNKLSYERMKKTMHELKINGCSICGYDKCDSALHFHHVGETNRKGRLGMQTAFLLSHSDEKIIKELLKCMLVCCNCHQEIHRGDD